jgi:hypothetical protein
MTKRSLEKIAQPQITRENNRDSARLWKVAYEGFVARPK